MTRVRTGLTAEALRLSYRGDPVVHDASVAVVPGRVTVLVGPNGSGKSTLLRSLARLHRPSAGTIILADGRAAQALSANEFARQVTLLSQNRTAPSGITVADVVAYGRHPHRSRWRSADPEGARAVAWAMDVTGVRGMADRAADELSGGELQRVWLATCLAQDTGVLLLDEPTNHLDLRYQVEVLDLVRDLADEHEVAVGMVLHDLNQAAAVADRMTLMDGGRVVATGPPATVLTPEHVSQAYGVTVTVDTDPDTGALRVQPLGRRRARTAAVHP